MLLLQTALKENQKMDIVWIFSTLLKIVNFFYFD